MSNITDKNFKSNNSEDMRNKQIEEMKQEVCICCSKLMDCHEHLKGICGFMKMIEMLYDIGYRKQKMKGEEK